ncbi:MAG: hypothetical protein A3F73_06555 [Gallionellales bacterium RIFCSPLOWO2_12_FULL_59_22]|nr:MAG: hypothetical protein A3H99_11440 [Gallionellales bacterium RIFCSPLOWO2_02_FULL_59_110]OGT02438.1 MAG: hypothetical protein A2Z65_08785 [Gallionellales bacterium RIFCSPLOWO2_02_58_13]OGT13458.1 MAG: hypothetical protein A3F73_06555 [Gallionellales bacterium RIFCSPLOWO2_12_FULL_59_22]
MADLIPQGSHQKGVPGTVYLVEEQCNPSTDYFVLPAVSAGRHRVVRCGFADLPPSADLDGAAVVFVRYVPPAWAKLVEAVRPRLRRLAFFMDDDVLEVGASAGLPWRYRFKLARLATWRSSWLQRQAAELWVSTPYLQLKYSGWRPRLVLPSPAPGCTDVRRIFYHGTASHAAEIRWLRPVVEEALRRDERLAFEVAGGRDVHRLYRGVQRATVVHPMKWPAYRAFLDMPWRHVGLVPLLDMPFNRARSYTKFFDITRCGAVGIYAPDSACADVIRHGVDGLVVAQEPEAWVEAILHLAQDEPQRSAMFGNAEKKMTGLADRAQRGYAELM